MNDYKNNGDAYDYSHLYGADASTQDGWHEVHTNTTAGEPYANRETEEQRVQRELEQALREMGDTLRDGFTDFRREFGPHARAFGGAVADAVDYSLGLARDAFKDARAQQGRPRRSNSGFGYGPGKNLLQKAAGGHWGKGLALAIVGGFFGFGTLLSSIIVLLASFVSGPDEFYMMISSGICAVTSLPFLWMFSAGMSKMRLARQLNNWGAAMGERSSISIAELAAVTQAAPAQVRKALRKILSRGWVTGWMDEAGEVFYLNAADWQTDYARRHGIQPQAEPESTPQPEPAADSDEPVADFVRLLEQEKRLMEDPLAVEELEQMKRTTLAIGEWVAQHPESSPKVRRLAGYYMPTTLKLLHTYNEVRGQNTDNAQNIRRDITGILHTLNIAFENLYNNLLQDVAMDISSEITALQGILAQDGLSPEGTPLNGLQ